MAQHSVVIIRRGEYAPPPPDTLDGMGVTFEEYVTMDEDLKVYGNLSEQDIWQVLHKKNANSSDVEEKEYEPTDTTPVPTASEDFVISIEGHKAAH